jgi:hypothetical protein
MFHFRRGAQIGGTRCHLGDTFGGQHLGPFGHVSCG